MTYVVTNRNILVVAAVRAVGTQKNKSALVIVTVIVLHLGVHTVYINIVALTVAAYQLYVIRLVILHYNI